MRGLHTVLSELNKAIARSYFEAYNTGDIDAVMKFIGSGYVLHPEGGGEPVNSDERKRDERVFFKAFSNIQAVVEDQIAENNTNVKRVNYVTNILSTLWKVMVFSRFGFCSNVWSTLESCQKLVLNTSAAMKMRCFSERENSSKRIQFQS